MTIRTLTPLGAAVCALILSSLAGAATINVPGDQPTLSAAVGAAVAGDEIVLADGVYTGAGNRNISIAARNLDIRSASGDPTACVIDLQDSGLAILFSGVASGTSNVEGITFRNGTGTSGRGGAIFSQNSNTRIANCVFESCDVTTGGGAIFGTQRSLIIEECVFDTNSASLFGGAIEVFNGIALTVDRCEFRNNSASIGGGIELGGGSNTRIASCLFDSNTASGSRFGFPTYGGGGVVVVSGAIAEIKNTTFVNNSTDHVGAGDGGGGLFVSNSTVDAYNCVFWNNSDLSGMGQDGQLKRTGGTLDLEYSLVEGLTGSLGGSGNIDSDPMFADASGGDFRPTLASPMVDAGSTPLAIGFRMFDLDNAPRVVDIASVPDTGMPTATSDVIDMGAYELQEVAACPEDLNGDDVVDSGDLAELLAGWGGSGPADFNGSGTVDASDLAILLAAWGAC